MATEPQPTAHRPRYPPSKQVLGERRDCDQGAMGPIVPRNTPSTSTQQPNTKVLSSRQTSTTENLPTLRVSVTEETQLAQEPPQGS